MRIVLGPFQVFTSYWIQKMISLFQHVHYEMNTQEVSEHPKGSKHNMLRNNLTGWNIPTLPINVRF